MFVNRNTVAVVSLVLTGFGRYHVPNLPKETERAKQGKMCIGLQPLSELNNSQVALGGNFRHSQICQ